MRPPTHPCVSGALGGRRPRARFCDLVHTRLHAKRALELIVSRVDSAYFLGLPRVTRQASRLSLNTQRFGSLSLVCKISALTCSRAHVRVVCCAQAGRACAHIGSIGPRRRSGTGQEVAGRWRAGQHIRQRRVLSTGLGIAWRQCWHRGSALKGGCLRKFANARPWQSAAVLGCKRRARRGGPAPARWPS